MTWMMATPLPFGPKHLYGSLFVVVVVVLSLILFLKVLKITKHKVVLQAATILLWGLEAMKQIQGILDAGGSYPLWALPFQLCSVPLYLFPIVAFGKGRLREFLLPGTFTISLCAALAMLTYPSTVLGTAERWFPLRENYFPLVSFSFHGVMVFFSLYLAFSGSYVPKFRDHWKAFVTMLGFALLAIVVNAIFQTDMMFLNTGYGMPFSFLLTEYNRAVYYGFMAVLAGVALALPFVPSIFRPRIKKI